MPELPEIETLRRDLEKEVVGKKIKAVEVLGTTVIPRHKAAKPFISRLEGAKIEGVTRKGMWLLLRLGEDVLALNMGTSSQIVKAAAKDPVDEATQLVLTFTVGGQLRFLDATGTGEAFLTSAEELPAALPELADMGFDPLDDVISWNTFGAALTAEKTRLKQLLMDSRFIAGIGTVYSDEILWAAGLRYDREASSLTTQDVRRLHRALLETLHDGVKYRGVSQPGDAYVDYYGKPGGFGNELKVVGREGQPCRRCRQKVVKSRYANKFTYHCGSCQV
jgi:formamidopyrimidine-DNA glycosylase